MHIPNPIISFCGAGENKGRNNCVFIKIFKKGGKMDKVWYNTSCVYQ